MTTATAQQQPTTELAPAPPPAAAKPARKPRPGAIVHLDFDTDQGFALAQRRANALSIAGAVPEMFRGAAGSPGWGNTLIALELAHRLDYPVLLVMQNLTLVDGRPGWQGKFYIALVQSGDRFRDHFWEWKGKPGADDYGARMVATRTSDGMRCEGQWIDVSLAKAEGWWSKKDRNGKEWSKWPHMTAQMLVYRSASFWTNQWNPGATLGIRSTEELEDVAESAPQLVAPPAPARAAVVQVQVEPSRPVASEAGPPAQASPTTPAPSDQTLAPGEDPPSMEEQEPLVAAPPAEDSYRALNEALAASDWRRAQGEIAKLPRGTIRDGAVDLYNQARRSA